MEEKREDLYQKLVDLKSSLFDDQEKEARLLYYNPKQASLLAKSIHSKKSKIQELQDNLNQLDAHFEESPSPPAAIQEDPLTPLLKIFEEGAILLNSKRNFLHYILGRHPYALLATLIQEGVALSKKIETDNRDLRVLLDAFIKEGEDPWNKRLYKGGFLEYGAQLALLKEKDFEDL